MRLLHDFSKFLYFWWDPLLLTCQYSALSGLPWCCPFMFLVVFKIQHWILKNTFMAKVCDHYILMNIITEIIQLGHSVPNQPMPPALRLRFSWDFHQKSIIIWYEELESFKCPKWKLTELWGTEVGGVGPKIEREFAYTAKFLPFPGVINFDLGQLKTFGFQFSVLCLAWIGKIKLYLLCLIWGINKNF